MAMRLIRGAAAAMLAAALLGGGCTTGGGSTETNVNGRWTGTLALGFAGGGGLNGGILLELTQEGDFASGIATWAAIGETQSATMPIDGDNVTLHLHFRCAEGTEIASIEGSVSGDTMSFSSASGSACALNGLPFAVGGADGTLTHTSDNIPM